MRAHDREAAASLHMELLTKGSQTDDIGFWMSGLKQLLMRLWSTETWVECSRSNYVLGLGDQGQIESFEYAPLLFSLNLMKPRPISARFRDPRRIL